MPAWKSAADADFGIPIFTVSIPFERRRFDSLAPLLSVGGSCERPATSSHALIAAAATRPDGIRTPVIRENG